MGGTPARSHWALAPCAAGSRCEPCSGSARSTSLSGWEQGADEDPGHPAAVKSKGSRHMQQWTPLGGCRQS